ncbi:MAG: AraC family transcriptional regulator [Candidatus Sulfotelmatobacter sp.]
MTGQSFVNYVRHFRISKAQEILASTDKSISDVSQQTGFCDQSYFGTVFRALAKMTPLTYRRRTVRPGYPDRTNIVAIMQSGRIGAFFLVFSSTLVAAQTKTAKEIEIPQFEDHSLTSGLTVSHISTPEQHYIVESMSGGIALFDCDDDGKLDIAVVNGSTVDRYRAGGDPLVVYISQRILAFWEDTG